MAHFEYRITSEDSGKALKTVVKERFAFSSRLMTRLRRDGLIRVNGEALAGWIPLTEGDTVTVEMPEERSGFQPEDIPVEVIYEDEHLLVVNKQPGIVVHPTKGNPSHTLLNGIMKKMLQDSESTGDPSGMYKARLVNRLDMNTSGLIVIAKNPYVQADLVKQMKSSMVKKYMALLEGVIDEDEGRIDVPLGKPDENEVERWVLPVEKGGQESITRYRVLKRYNCPHEMIYGHMEPLIERKRIEGYTLAEMKLETGRTHQIRIHMAEMGHPVVGDHLYCHGDPFEYRRVYGDPRPPLTGEKGPRGETNPEIISDVIARQALHAFSLDFIHPISGKKMHLEAPLPEDFKKAIEYIENGKNRI